MKIKRIYTTFFTAVMCTAGMHAQIYVERTNLNTQSLPAGSISFNQNTADRWALGLGGNKSYLSAWDVANFSRLYIPQSEEERSLAVYKAPVYADDYRSFNAWPQRNNWQLANVHDPTVMKAADGYYYMYQTDASYGNVHTTSGGHFLGRRSKDLVNWEYVGSSMRHVSAWVKDTLNSIRSQMGLSQSTINFSDDRQFGYWAPCVRKVNDNLYRMYYVITCPGTLTSSTKVGERSFIGLMESTNPADSASWVDKGMVVTQFSDQGLNFNGKSQWGGYYKYNAIDPSYIITPEGEHWLIYGSWHSGFPALRLNPETGKPLTPLSKPWGTSADEATYGKRIFTRYANNRWQDSEAPEVVYHDGYYYLFVAFDELAVNYNTRVLRSRNIDGPYVDMLGNDFTNGTSGGDVYPILTHPYKFGDNHGWVGISHCAVFDDGNGNWFYASQQRFPQNYNGDEYSNAIMMGGVRRILWTESGWPVVLPERYGNVPQAPITEEELAGTWQNLRLYYRKGEMDASTDIVLNEDHTVSGSPFNGRTWSFDADKNVLDIGGSKLYLAREADWESSPRHATIVYAGYNQMGNITFWGKHVSAPVAEAAPQQQTVVIGNEDNSTAWWSAFSDYLTSESGNCTFHYNFTNHSDKANNWDNWLIVITNGKERGETGYKEYVVLRADNYGWQGANNTGSNANGWFTSLTSNYNWDTFKDDLDGANVDITATISGGTLTITALTTTTANKTYNMTFVMPVENGTKGAFLTCEKAHLDLLDMSVEEK